jgi:hypothetical protein
MIPLVSSSEVMSRSDELLISAQRQVLTLPEKEQFVLDAISRMAQYTFPFICSVIGVSDPKMGRHCGSALRCNLNGKRVVLTAQHVLHEAMKEPYGLAISIGYGQPPHVVHGTVNTDPVSDLAIYCLPDDYPCPDTAFWPARRIDRFLDKLSTDYLFLHGFPGKSSYPSVLLNGVVSKSLPYGAMQRLENLPSDLQPCQFAVEYDPVGMLNATGAVQEVVDPHGLSGCPVWRIGAAGRSSSEWTTNDSLLVGILTQWRPDEKVLIATSTAMLPPSG